MQLVKVKYYSDTMQTVSEREYTYFSADILQVGDNLIVPVRDTTGKARVTSVDVPESSIEKFKDAVKTIPTGSLIKEGEQTVKEEPKVEILPQIEGTTAIIIVSPETNSAVKALTTEVLKLSDYALNRIVIADSDLIPLTDDLTLIAKVKKAVTDYKEAYIRPIKNHLDSVSAVFNGLLGILKEAEATNKSKFTAYTSAQEKRAKEIEETNRMAQEVARRQAEQNHGEFTVDTAPIAAPAPVRKVETASGDISINKIPKHEVIDFKALPDDYKIADEAKLQKVIKAANGKITIAGVRIWYEDSVRTNTR